MEENYADSIRDVDIEKLCLDSKFGELSFSAVVDSLKRMIKDIVELEDYDYRKNLTQVEINQIETVRNTVRDFISQIQGFSITQPNSAQTRESLVQTIQNYYQNSFAKNIREPILYLRDQVRSTTKSNEVEYRRLAKELQGLLNEVKEDKAKLEMDKVSIEQGRGIITTKYLSNQFEEEVKRAGDEARGWQKWTFWFALGMIALVAFLFSGYWGYARWFDPTGKIEYGIFSATLIASFFFFLKVLLRNYNITKHIETGNKHRSNVAATLEGLLAQANQDDDLRIALLKEGSMAMFQADSTGYLTKDQIEVSTPVKEIINTVMSK